MKTSDVKAEYIKTRIAQMLKADPKLTFQQAWTRLERERPDWFKDDEEEEPDDEPGQLRQPHLRPPVQTSHTETAVSRMAGKLDVAEIAMRMGIPVRVQAAEDGSEYFNCSAEHGGSIKATNLKKG